VAAERNALVVAALVVAALVVAALVVAGSVTNSPVAMDSACVLAPQRVASWLPGTDRADPSIGAVLPARPARCLMYAGADRGLR
jgi:glycerol uptake facilitator-like aquaporin